MKKIVVYEAITDDGKEFKIYDNGLCEGDIKFKYVFNHFQPYINTQIAKGIEKLKASIIKSATKLQTTSGQRPEFLRL